MASTGLPEATVARASRRLARSHAPAEWMNWMLEKCGLVAVLVSLRTMRPFAASAMKTSIESSDWLDRNASQRPSGLSAGPTLSSALNSRPWMIGSPIHELASSRQQYRHRARF